MNQTTRHEGRDGAALPLLLAALVVAWAVMGWRDLGESAQAGFDTDGNHTVIRVQPESPAGTAGLQRGDVITHIERIAVTDAGAIARLPRVRAGETRLYTVARDGEEQTLAVRFAPLSPRALALGRAASIIGLCFLAFPLLAWWRRPGEATRILLVMGFGLSFAFIGGPWIAEASIRALVVAVTSLFVLAGVAALMQFLLVFPIRRPWLDSRGRRRLLYLPALLLWALLAWRVLATPASTGLLNAVTNLAAGIIVGGYLLVALFLVLRNYSRTDRGQRRALALNGMLWGTILGLLPAIIGQLVAAFSPQSVLPGQDYYFVSLALIPLSWARSASRPQPGQVSVQPAEDVPADRPAG